MTTATPIASKKPSTLIGRYVRKPQRKSEKVEIRSLYCSLEDCHNKCSLLKQDKCIHNRILSAGCIYGSSGRKIGPTQRARKYYSFVADAEKDIKNNSLIMPSTAYINHLIEIGDYIFLPYSFMNLCKEIPFFRAQFIEIEDFTPEIIVIAANFKAMSLFGGEIKQYQEEQVPLFLLHLKHMMPDLFEQACKLDPNIAKKIFRIEDITNLEGTLDMIPVGRVDGYTINNKKQKVLIWDGKTLKAECGKPLLQGYMGENYIIEYKPIVEKTKIYITEKKLIFDVIMKYPETISKESFKK